MDRRARHATAPPLMMQDRDRSRDCCCRRTPTASSTTSASADRWCGFLVIASPSASRVTAGAAGISRPATAIATPAAQPCALFPGDFEHRADTHRIVQTGIGLSGLRYRTQRDESA